MIGRRIEPGEGIFWQPGDYWFDGERWMAATPNNMLANLTRHEVTEHGNKTISVSPSILTTGGEDNQRWHGFLDRGTWREIE